MNNCFKLLFNNIITVQQVPVSPVETCLQITDALSYLEGLGLVHSGVSSHSIVMTTVNVAKLGLMERTVRAGEIPPEPLEFLFNWTSPEILLYEAEWSTIIGHLL